MDNQCIKLTLISKLSAVFTFFLYLNDLINDIKILYIINTFEMRKFLQAFMGNLNNLNIATLNNSKKNIIILSAYNALPRDIENDTFFFANVFHFFLN